MRKKGRRERRREEGKEGGRKEGGKEGGKEGSGKRRKEKGGKELRNTSKCDKPLTTGLGVTRSILTKSIATRSTLTRSTLTGSTCHQLKFFNVLLDKSIMGQIPKTFEVFLD